MEVLSWVSPNVFSRHHRKVKLLFALADVALVLAAFAAAYQLRSQLPFERLFFLTFPELVLMITAVLILWPLAGYWVEVFERLDSALPRTILRESFRQTAAGIIGLILFQYLLRLDLSRGFIGLLAVFSWIFLCIFRLNAGRLVGWIRREFGANLHVLVVGGGERARSLAAKIELSAEYGIRLAGIVGDDDSLMAGLPEFLEKHVIDEVVFAVDSQRLAALEEVMLLCDEEGVRTRVAVDFFPHVNSDLYLERFGQLPLLTFAAAPHDEIRLFAKRVLDVALAGAALVLLAPLMALIALAIRLTSPGPAIFTQVRCGLNGRRFTFYKFRSMVQNAEDLKAGLEHLNRKQVAFKIPNDPRATTIGRFLRKFSVDEWPQLWNVVRGDMSLVGPRPAVPEEVERYQRWQRRRLRMRPGLTCLWALEGRDRLDFDSWMRKDMEYIDNWSLSLDWKIILRTIPNVLLGKGAH
jgi:exopolysaccharide biosynthesis polyprenyl glycosylphosphotransferase